MEYLFTFKNTHYAIYSEKILKKENIPVGVMALPSQLGDFCGICLRLSSENVLKGKELLQLTEIPVEKIFKIEKAEGKRIYTPWKN